MSINTISKEDSEKLMNEMNDLLIQRGDNDRLNELNEEDFSKWLIELEKEYQQDDIKTSFKEYIVTSIYDVVCCE